MDGVGSGRADGRGLVGDDDDDDEAAWSSSGVTMTGMSGMLLSPEIWIEGSVGLSSGVTASTGTRGPPRPRSGVPIEMLGMDGVLEVEGRGEGDAEAGGCGVTDTVGMGGSACWGSGWPGLAPWRPPASCWGSLDSAGSTPMLRRMGSGWGSRGG